MVDSLDVAIREYTITIETPEATTANEDVMTRFNKAILETPNALGPSALLDRERGVISSRFRVEADTLATAHTIGINLFAGALRDAGVTTLQHYEVVAASEGPIVG
jgi:hypothetical protein